MLKINYKYKTDTLLWLLIISFLIIFHFRHPLNDDEGVALEGALNIFNHRQIYQDFFEFVTPGVFYLLAWSWKIFGIHYFVAKILAILAVFMSAFGVYKISQNISKQKLNSIGALLLVLASALWPIIIYHTFNLVFMIWALWFLLKALDQPKYQYFIASGLLTGLAVLFMQNKGLLFMASLSSFLLILSIKNKNYFKNTIAYTLASLLTISILLIKWSPVFLYQNLILFPLQHYTGLPNISYSLLIISVLWIATIIFLLIRERNKKIYLLIYTQIILLLSTFSLPDIFHISLVLFPSYSLLALSLNKISSKTFNQKMIFYTLITSGIIINVMPAIVWPKYFTPFSDSSKNNIILDYIKKNCLASEYIYAGPFSSSLYFETKLKNPTSFSWLITNHHSAEQFSLAASDLAEHKPLCAVLDYSSVSKYNYNLDNPVDNYILANYHQEKSFDTILIYKINDL
ncbi:MAG: glycosyltransferase family 39 protein [Patescibacteria group bacterium]